MKKDNFTNSYTVYNDMFFTKSSDSFFSTNDNNIIITTYYYGDSEIRIYQRNQINRQHILFQKINLLYASNVMQLSDISIDKLGLQLIVSLRLSMHIFVYKRNNSSSLF